MERDDIITREMAMPSALLSEECRLSGRARVGGTSTTAFVLSWHLDALGFRVETGAECPDECAAVVELVTDDRRCRKLRVDWGGPCAEVVDEATAQAVCGLMHVHGRRDGSPRGLGVDYCSTAAAVVGCTGLLASLLDEGSSLVRVHTSVTQAALLTVSQYLAVAGADEPDEVASTAGGGPFTSADGVTFELEALQPEPWAHFWAQLGAKQAAVARSWRPFQFRFTTATASMDAGLDEAARGTDFAAICRAAEESGVSVCRVRTHHNAPSARESGLLPPWAAQPTGPSGSAPNRRTPASATFPARQSPLSGTHVLEAGRRVQGPLAAHVLSLLGAQVTRVEPPGGDPTRGMPPTCGPLSARWLALNRNKDAVELDIKSPADRAALRARAEQADVFLHNWAPGKAESLELDAHSLPAHLVYAYTSALGRHNLDDPPLGTDFMVQARSGIADLVRPAGEEPAPSLMTLLDVLGGLLGAEAVVAGLLFGREHGSGLQVDSSLYDAAIALAKPLSARGITRRPAGFRQPRPHATGWHLNPDTPSGGASVAVSTDLAALLSDPRVEPVLDRDKYHCPTVLAPWRFA